MFSRAELQQAIVALEARKDALGAAVTTVAVEALQAELVALEGAGARQARRRQVTVIYADVAGFTAMSENLDPEEVHAAMNRVWQLIDGAIVERGGVVERHIGDAVLGIFGAETAHEDHAVRAVRAALDALEALEALSGVVGGQPGTLGMRVGVHTGSVVLGQVGTTEESTAIGAAVEIASRLEHAAEVGRVLISRDTWHHVRDRFDTEAGPPLDLKGRGAAMPVFFVSGDAPDPATSRRRVTTPLVGRVRALESLEAGYGAVAAGGRGRMVLVVGEAGLGKTRLLEAFEASLGNRDQRPDIFRGATTQPGRETPFGLFRSLFLHGLGLTGEDPVSGPERLRRALVHRLGADGEEAAHFIGHLLGYPFPDSPFLAHIRQDAEQIRGRAFYFIREVMARVGPDRVIVVFFEDLHAADSGSLELIDWLLDTCATMPLLFVGASRPSLLEEKPDIFERSGEAMSLARILLEPLTPKEAEALVWARLVRVPRVPRALVDTVVRSAGGNPFYAEELIETLIDEGVIEVGDEVWRINPERLGALSVPTTLTAVLQARLDALAPDEREVLERAAIIGRVFWDEAILALGEGMSLEAVTGVLRRLAARGLLVAGAEVSADVTVAGARSWAFKHAPLHTVTYEQVLLARRREGSGKVARWLVETLGEAGVAPFAARLARDFTLAGDGPAAGHWHLRAGDASRESGNTLEAIDHYAQALDQLSDLEVEERLEAQGGYAETLAYSLRYEEALTASEAMLEAARRLGNVEAEIRALSRSSAIRMVMSDHAGAWEDARLAVELARAAEQPIQLAAALARLSSAEHHFGRMAPALAAAEEACEVARAAGDPITWGKALLALVWMRGTIGEFEASEAAAREARGVFAMAGHRVGMAQCLTSLGEIARLKGDFAAAARWAREGLAVYESFGDRDGVAVVLNNLGGALVGLAEYEEAEQALRDVLAQVGPQWWISGETRRFLAEALMGQGRHEDAFDSAVRAVEHAEVSKDASTLGPAWRVLGRILAAFDAAFEAPPALPEDLARDWRGPEPTSAELCFERSFELASEAGMAPEARATLHTWADHLEALGDTDRAEALRARAEAL